MKNRDMTKILISGFLQIGIFFLGQTARADGAGSSGGGDSRCQDYARRLKNVAFEIKRNESAIASQLPGVDFSQVVTIGRNNKCLPVLSLDRQARSFPKENTTHLLANAYDKLLSTKKTFLAVHELLVLNETETDGEYYFSEKIIKILNAVSRDFRIEMIEAASKIFNQDGTITFLYPRVEYQGHLYYIGVNDRLSGWDASGRTGITVEFAPGYCVVLGLLPAKKEISNFQMITFTQYLKIFDSGVISKIDTIRSDNYLDGLIASVTCK